MSADILIASAGALIVAEARKGKSEIMNNLPPSEIFFFVVTSSRCHTLSIMI